MFINDIVATDYFVTGDRLTIAFTNATEEALLTMNTESLIVTTNVGAPVENLVGWTRKIVLTKNLQVEGEFALVLEKPSPLEEELKVAQGEIEKLEELIKSQDNAHEQELRDLGISVRPDPKAEYDPTKRYIEGDVMTFKGEKYKSLTYNKDQSPETHPDRWELLPVEEEVILVWLDCETNHPFEENDKVSHTGYIWRCKRPHNKGNVRVPLEGSDWWEIVTDVKVVRG